MPITIPYVSLSMQLALYKTSTIELLSSHYLNYPIDDHLKSFMMYATTIYDSLGKKPYAFIHKHRTGRPRVSYDAMFFAHIARCYYQIPTVKLLVGFLQTHAALREFCGFSQVPSEATFSRFLTIICEKLDIDESVGTLSKDFFQDSLVGNICRDSTTIAANDKAITVGSRTKIKAVKKKRGRKKKGSPEEKEAQERRLEKETNNPLVKQVLQEPEESIACLNRKCAFGAKTNAFVSP